MNRKDYEEFESYDSCSSRTQYKILKTLCSNGNIKSHHDLKRGRYNINHMKVCHTKYGPRVVVSIANAYYYIPCLFTAEMAWCKSLNEDSYKMIYHGADGNEANVEFMRVQK